MGLLDQMLVEGDDSLIYEELVKKHGYTGQLLGGINVDLGDMFDYDGPMLWTTYLIHDASVKPEQIMASPVPSAKRCWSPAQPQACPPPSPLRFPQSCWR